MYLTPEEIKKFYPAGARPQNPNDLAQPLRDGILKAEQMHKGQMAGNNFPIACVALEITQRCNLDCTLCYLSDLAEAIEDVPLFEIKRRIKQIYGHYGAYTNIQITGGDPTLRSIPDLVEIVKEIKSFKMRCALFTNGIKASREMLEALCAVGLDDVVFHVDMTQERKGYNSEEALNAIRLEYIDRAKDLPMRILFNTTIYDDNVADLTKLVEFFVSQASLVNLASFQMQADTGRGVIRNRNEDIITQQSVMKMLERGTGVKLPFDIPMIGHSDCNKYTAVLVADDVCTPLYDDKKFFTALFPALAKKGKNWSVEENVIAQSLQIICRNPQLLFMALRYGLRKIWVFRKPLLKGKRPHRISFFIHNFMDEKKLDRARCEACVFMVATANGPLSMCVHNAKRDQMISQKVPEAANQQPWNPLSSYEDIKAQDLPIKRLKGRLRQAKKMSK